MFSPRVGTAEELDWVKVSARPRLLMLATQPFDPPNTGARIRNYYLARELSAHFDVTYLSFSDRAEMTAQLGAEPPAAAGRVRVLSVAPSARYGLKKLVLGAVGSKPVTVLNYTTELMVRTLANVLEEFDFDVVQVESLHLFAYLPVIRAAKSSPVVTLDWHNIESELMRRYSSTEPNPARRVYARLTAAKLENIERRALAEFDAHIVVSGRDRAALLNRVPEAKIYLAENGADVEALATGAIEDAYVGVAAKIGGPDTAYDNPVPRTTSARPRLVFVGSMDYVANQDAMLYFAREIWPELYAAHPNLLLTIVGRRPSAQVRELRSVPGIEVTGTVDDVRPYYREALAAIAPLRIGGGSRLKIVEAMAAGVPVVSTPLGAEGLDVEDGRNILLASDSEAFRNAINLLSQDQAEAGRLSRAGRELAIEKYSWRRIGNNLFAIYTEISKSRSLDAGPVQPLASGRFTQVHNGTLGARRRVMDVSEGIGEAS